MRIALMIGLAAVLLGSARAQAADAPTIVRGEDTTVFKKKTTIDFSDVTLEGELTKPEGQYGLARGKTKFNSLIKLRANFTPELQKSVDQL
jgi:hypothetical protein